MNKQQYQDMQKLAQHLENRFRDLCDNISHPIARSFEQRLRKLEDDLQTTRNPRSIEHHVADLEDDFDRLDNLEVMDHNHASYFADQMRQIKISLRNFDNY